MFTRHCVIMGVPIVLVWLYVPYHMNRNRGVVGLSRRTQGSVHLAPSGVRNVANARAYRLRRDEGRANMISVDTPMLTTLFFWVSCSSSNDID
jgi:hypothetical protein